MTHIPGDFQPYGDPAGFVPPREPPPRAWPSDRPRRKKSLSEWIRAVRGKISRRR